MGRIFDRIRTVHTAARENQVCRSFEKAIHPASLVEFRRSNKVK
jgi:hypothetical protein